MLTYESTEKEILAAIGLTEGDVNRYRGCYIDEDDHEIVVMARTGGLNRGYFSNKILERNPYYLYDRDNEFDRTYADYHFRIPEGVLLEEWFDEGDA